MNINLFWLSNSKEGGYRSHFIHFRKAMHIYGHAISTYMIANHDETFDRKFIDNATYRNVTLNKAIQITRDEGGLIFTAYWPYKPENITALLKAGCSIILSGGHEMYDDLLKEIVYNKSKLIVIGDIMQKSLKDIGVDSTCIPLVYVPSSKYDNKHNNAISGCRVDFMKNTHMIVEANKHLSDYAKINIYTNCINRLYVYHKLNVIDENWEECIIPRVKYDDTSPVPFISRYDYFVDMTSINKDGGRVQYTFLEAFDARCILVVNRKWISDGQSEINDTNSIPVSSVEELEYTVISDPSISEYRILNGVRIVDDHAPKHIVPLYEELLLAN